MKLHLTLAVLALGTTLFATAALADSMSTSTVPNNMMAAAPKAMAPTHSGMMATYQPKPKSHTTNAMGETNTMAPANTMAPSNTMGGTSH